MDFSTPHPITCRIETRCSGRVTLTATDTHTSVVTLTPHGKGADDVVSHSTVDLRGDTLVITVPKAGSSFFGRGPEVHVDVRLPSDSTLDLSSGSADLWVDGRLAQADAETGSGDVRLDVIGRGSARTGSGDVTIGSCAGDLLVKTGSGDVAGEVVDGDVEAKTGSGDVVFGRVSGHLQAKTGSGDLVVKDPGTSSDLVTGSADVVLNRVVDGRHRVRTGSGDVAIGVADGTSAYLDVSCGSGEARSELDDATSPRPDTPVAEIHVLTGSGDAVIKRA